MSAPLLILKDTDVFSNSIVRTQSYTLRLAVKVIVFDEDKRIALVGKKYRLLPGGAVESGETLIEAAKRECLEEVGCDIKICREIGLTEDFRCKIRRHQITHFFLAKMVGMKGKPLTKQDDEQGIQVRWCSLSEAIRFLQKESIHIDETNYNFSFNVLTHLAALKVLRLERATFN